VDLLGITGAFTASGALVLVVCALLMRRPLAVAPVPAGA
jgi:hypothetical protein